MKDFSAIYGLSEELDRVQRNVEDVLQPVVAVVKSPFLDGNLVTATLPSPVAPATTTSTEILHNLGRDYKGFIVVKRVMADGTAFAGTITDGVPSNSNIYIKLSTTVGVTVTVWVF